MTGDIIATGSNDKTIRMTRFDAENCNSVGNETLELFCEDLTDNTGMIIKVESLN